MITNSDSTQNAASTQQLRSHEVLVGNESLNFRSVWLEDPVPTGRQILAMAGAIPATEHLIFQWGTSRVITELGLDETVDIRRAGAEKFLIFRSDRSFRYELDGQIVEWGASHISGIALKKISDVDAESHDLWLDLRAGGPGRKIADTELVDLSGPETERFFTTHKTIAVIVNTLPHNVHGPSLSFLEVVKLAYPDAVISETRIYTVTYKRGPASNPQGSLVNGHSVQIKDGMVFNVTFTDKS